jgi:hypothetical protein
MKTLSSSRLLVGGHVNPKNLHSYGDKDGVETEAKLQHPLGVHFIPEKNVILVTDTYNHKIKVIDPFRNEIFSWLGSGQTKIADGATLNCSFYEPSGVSSLYDEKKRDVKVYICDTNNHCIRKVYYDIGTVSTPEIRGVPLCMDGECSPEDLEDYMHKDKEIHARSP